jgi:hypothetical protein
MKILIVEDEDLAVKKLQKTLAGSKSLCQSSRHYG